MTASAARGGERIAVRGRGVVPVGGDGQVVPGSVGLGPRPGGRRRVGVGLAAQDQPQRRLGHPGHLEHDPRHLGRVAERARAPEVVVQPGHRADGRLVRLADGRHPHGGPGPVGLTSLGVVDEAAALVARVLPALTMAEAREFVATLASLAGSLWQIANPAPALAELYASDPTLAQACVDLAPRLRRTAEILLAGLEATGGQGQSSWRAQPEPDPARR